MSVNGKFKSFTEDDLLADAERFGVGTARTVIEEVRNAIAAWPTFARQAGIEEKQVKDIGRQHLLLL
jgi:serine/threonine-protein kinase HipA